MQSLALSHAFAVPPYLAGFAVALLGIWIVLHERGSWISLTFLFLTLSVGAWLTSFGWAYSTASANEALLRIKIANSAVVFIPASLLSFTLAVTGRFKRFALTAALGWGISFLFLTTLWVTRDFVTGVHLYFWGYYPAYGKVTYAFLAYFTLIMAFCLFFFYRGYSSTQGLPQNRYKTFLLAFSAGYFASVDYLPAYGIPVYPFGYLPVFIFVALMAAGHLRYRLIDITPSLAAEQILKTMVDALLVIDREGTVRAANQAASKLFGIEELEGKPVSATGFEFFSKGLARLWSGNIRNMELPFIHKKVESILEFSSSVVRNKKGAAVASVCIIKDITIRKRAEQQLAEREKHYRLLAENLSDVIWTMDTNLKWTYVSPSILRFTGYTQEEAMALSLEQTLTPVSYKEARLIFTQEQVVTHSPAQGFHTRTFEVEYRSKSGGIIWAEIKATFIHQPDGRVSEIVGVTRDIMERKRVEEALSASERSYADLVKAATEPILMLDRQGILQSINPAGEYALGYHADEVTGKHVQNILQPESVAKTLQEFTLAFLGWNRVPFELHLRRKDGGRLVMEATPRLFRRDSEATFMQILCRPIGRGDSAIQPVSA